MIEKIKNCQKCGLYQNQRPLLDKKKECQVFWVGISAKMVDSEDEVPLSPKTNTGMLIKRIEDGLPEISAYKTNLVKCVPLTEQQKIRYPNKREMECCFENLLMEMHTLSPRIVFLLGEKVYSSVGRQLKITFEKWNEFEYRYKEYEGKYFVPVHHPSYIYTYRRKKIEQYMNGIEKVVRDLL